MNIRRIGGLALTKPVWKHCEKIPIYREIEIKHSYDTELNAVLKSLMEA
jgi:hypothetical protein